MSKPDIKILKLTLKKKWFDLIAEGEKKTEYRSDGRWIRSRVFTKAGSWREYDEVHFTNGYGANKPFVSAKFRSITYACGKNRPVNNEPDVKVDDYAICLGEVLEIRNWRENKEADVKEIKKLAAELGITEVKK